MNVITQTKFKGKLTITRKTPILAEVNTGLRHQEEVWNIMGRFGTCIRFSLSRLAENTLSCEHLKNSKM